MIKPKFKYLRVGQKIEVKIVEVHSQWFIVSFKGQLLRVENKTGLKFKEQSKIDLIIKKVAPLKFAIPSASKFQVWA